jgi:RimJ/RimL family protein N-acetyltransferase
VSDNGAVSSVANIPPLPTELTTARLLLRKWQPDDVAALGPVLAANRSHLAPWIPPHVAAPADDEQLSERIKGFVLAFDSGQYHRYALWRRDTGMLLGGVDLFGRAAAGRVPLSEASCAELGYWLRADGTGQGYATEAVSVLIAWLRAHATLTHLEIRCDARNAPSRRMAQRLGCTLVMTTSAPSIDPNQPPIALDIWHAPPGA